MRSRLRAATAQEVPEHDVLDALRGLEDLTRAAAALTARLSTAFEAGQVAAQTRDDVAPSRRGQAVADDLALIRKTSPYLASRELVAARALVREMPGMLTALGEGHIDALTARMVTEETICLESQDRARIDELLAPRVPGMSSRQLRAEVRALTQELDPEALIRRARKAVADRGVWVRPVPDVMALLSARLPAAAAIACYKALAEHADALKASGDERTRAQIMADELFARLTGRSAAEGVDVEVQVVMTDASLFEGDPAAAILTGYGPVPAQSARDLLYPDDTPGQDEEGAPADPPAPAEVALDDRPSGDDTDPAASTPGRPATFTPGADSLSAPAAANTPGADSPSAPEAADRCPDGPRCTTFSCGLLHGTPLPGAGAAPPNGQAFRAAPPREQAYRVGPPGEAYRAARVWLRRLYADPSTGALTRRDLRRRNFPADIRAIIVSRDQYCRTPWCGAPIRHADHRIRWADDGPSDLDNGQGLCARCNLRRERARARQLTPSEYLPPPPILPTLIPQARAG